MDEVVKPETPVLRSRTRIVLRMDDVDAFGIVFFGRYTSWFQCGIEDLMAANGHELREILDSGIGFPMVKFELECFRPARLSDVIFAESRLAEVGNRSIHFHVDFVDAQGELLATAKSVQVSVRRTLGPEPVPDWLRAMQSGPEGSGQP